MDWSEPANIYLRSHDIWDNLFLVVLYGDILFKLVYQVRLDWLPLPCIALIRPIASIAQLVERLPSKQYVVGLNPT